MNIVGPDTNSLWVALGRGGDEENMGGGSARENVRIPLIWLVKTHKDLQEVWWLGRVGEKGLYLKDYFYQKSSFYVDSNCFTSS